MFFVHNGDQELQMAEVRGQVGSKKWTVVSETGAPAAIKSLDETVAERTKNFKLLKASQSFLSFGMWLHKFFCTLLVPSR